MTFPSDYKRVQQPGGTEGIVDAEVGLARQLIIDTSNWNIRLLDGAAPGGYTVVMAHELEALLQDPDFLSQGAKVDVENGTVTTAMIWSPSILQSIFAKFLNVSTAGSWFVKSAGMPVAMRDAAAQTLDADAITVNGFYMADPSACLNLPAAIPTSNSLNVAIMVVAQSIDNLIQIAFIRDGSAKFWIRTKTDTVWGAWILASGVTSADLATKLSLDGTTPMTGDLDMNSNDIRGVLTLNDSPIWHADSLINGTFDQWTRGITQSTSGYGSDDRWVNINSGSTKVHTQQQHTFGSNVPGNPKFFSQTVVTSVAGVNNIVVKSQRIEQAQTHAGELVTVTFWGNADSVRDIAIEFRQVFGTGGSPSADVFVAPQRVTIGGASSFQKRSIVFSIPSISGKTLGTNNNDFLEMNIWFDAGSNFNARTLNLGQQSGTFQLSQFSVIRGDVRKEINPTPKLRPEEVELKCLPFYETGTMSVAGYASSATMEFYMTVPWKRNKRKVPTLGFTSTATTNVSTFDIRFPGTKEAIWYTQSTAAGPVKFNGTWTSDSEI